MALYDKDIRQMLLAKIATTKTFVNDPTTIVVHELDICSGNVRADLAVINGKFYGYEIKSERDTLDRLPSQVEYYGKIFDRVTLVLGENHLEKALEIIPKWWGVYCVNKSCDRSSLKRFRQPKANELIDAYAISEFLWKDELIELLALAGHTKGVASKTRKELRKIAINKIDGQEIKDFVRCKLKGRSDWRAVSIQQLCDDLSQL